MKLVSTRWDESCSCRRRTTSTRSTTSAWTIFAAKSRISWSSWEKSQWDGRIEAICRIYIRYNFKKQYSSKIETLFLNSQARFRNHTMKMIVSMIREIFKMLNRQSYVTSQPVFFPPHPDLCGMLSFSLGMPSRNSGSPSVWDTHGVPGNVFANPTASSSAPYPQESNPWISNVSEHTSPHVMSESQTPVQDQRYQSRPSARNSVIPSEGGYSKNCGASPTADFGSSRLRHVLVHNFLRKLGCGSKKLGWSVDDLTSSCSVRGIQMPKFWSTRWNFRVLGYERPRIRWRSSRSLPALDLSAYVHKKMEHTPKLLRIPKSNIPRHKLIQVTLQYGRPSRSSWAKSVRSSFDRTVMEKTIWENFISSTIGRRFPNRNTFSYSVKKDYSRLCMWMTWNWLARNKTLIWCENTRRRSWCGRTNIFPRSCLFGLLSKTMWNTQRYCWQLQNHVRITSFRGGIEKLPYSENLRISSWSNDMKGHAKEMCGTILWVDKQDDSTILQRINSMCWFPSSQRRRIEICWRIVRSMFSNCSEVRTFEHVMEDLIFYYQWINLHDRSQKWINNCDKWLSRLISSINYTCDEK